MQNLNNKLLNFPIKQILKISISDNLTQHRFSFVHLILIKYFES